jgi:hypothetical protein
MTEPLLDMTKGLLGIVAKRLVELIFFLLLIFFGNFF